MQKSASMAATFWWRPLHSWNDLRTVWQCVLLGSRVGKHALHLVHCSPAPGSMQPNAQSATRHSAFETGGFPVGRSVG
eukprot:2160321-Prymnesium_polylepis.1